MAPRSAEEKARRRVEAARKKEEREAKKKVALEEETAKQVAQAARKAARQEAYGGGGDCIILDAIPDESFHQILACLPARELASVSLTCQQWNYSIREARIPYLIERLKGTQLLADSNNVSDDCRLLLTASYGGGDTKRVVTKKQRKSTANRGDCDEFMAYARFLEEGICGYSQLSTHPNDDSIYLPSTMTNGRYCSASPEHSVVRVGGGDTCGGGGSGVASWGVGRRGQLGNGQREDVALPERLSGMMRFGHGSVRIVQVSAGGGLVRVAHSLFLTSAGHVLSCGNGSYGQLGHGYSGAKQLPDYVRPKYIDAFRGMHMTCISAGEIHSACVNSDGDLYTFGDGFLGMLGHADKRPQVAPKQVKQGGLEDECVATVACGCRHTLVVTDDGDVFSMGFGHFGVLGRSFTPYEYDAGAALDNVGGGGDLEQDAGFVPLPVAPPPAAVVARLIEEDAVLREEREREELRVHLDLLANLTLDDPSDQCIPKIIDSLKGIPIVGVSAGHRHSILLDKHGGVFTCGSGVTGALGHGNNLSHMYPMKVMEFDNENIQIRKISAGVDMSMAVSTAGTVYSWGKSDGGRLGLGLTSGIVSIPRPVDLRNSKGDAIKAIDAECAFVHSLIVGLDGTLHQCGGVGIDGAADGQQNSEQLEGKPEAIPDFNIWHRLTEPKEVVKTEKYQKYGKYKLQGRSKMMGR